MAHFQLPLDLPHAGRIAERLLTLIEAHLEELELDAPDLMDAAEALSAALFRFVDEDENPPGREATEAQTRAADLARKLVDELEAAHIAGDRLGQLVRNLFECLELGEEGARISLRAGESPDSLQRPV
jgi:AcrR family transcriptional regulator